MSVCLIFGNERARGIAAQLRGPEGLGETPATVLHAPDERDKPEKYVRTASEPGTRAVHGLGTRPPGVGAAIAGNGRFADAQRAGRHCRVPRRDRERRADVHRLRGAIPDAQVSGPAQ